MLDSGLTEVVKPDGRQYTLKHGKVLVEAIVAGIEPLELRRKMGKNMRFDLVTPYLDEFFSVIAKQQRDQAVIEASDPVCRQTAKRCDARSVAAAGIKPQGSAADEHDSRASAKATGVRAERNRRYVNNECFVCGKQGHKQRYCPRSRQNKEGKGVHGHSHGQTPISSNPPTVPLSIPGARQPGRPLRLQPLELANTRPPQQLWLRKPNLLRLNCPSRMTTTTCTFACCGRRWRQ